MHKTNKVLPLCIHNRINTMILVNKETGKTTEVANRQDVVDFFRSQRAIKQITVKAMAIDMGYNSRQIFEHYEKKCTHIRYVSWIKFVKAQLELLGFELHIHETWTIQAK